MRAPRQEDTSRHLLFVPDGLLLARACDPVRLQVSGEPQSVAIMSATYRPTLAGARHLEGIQKLREIVRANPPEFRSMVK